MDQPSVPPQQYTALRLSLPPPLYPSKYPSISLSFFLSLYRFFYPSLYSIPPSNPPFIPLPLLLSAIPLSIHPSICLYGISLYLSLYPILCSLASPSFWQSCSFPLLQYLSPLSSPDDRPRGLKSCAVTSKSPLERGVLLCWGGGGHQLPFPITKFPCYNIPNG